MDDRIHIYYPRGQMVLILTNFFPCTVREAKIVFPLINTYAQDTEKEKLRQFLIHYVREKQEVMREMEADYHLDRKQPGRNYSRARTLYKRALRNLEFLEE